MHDSLIFGHLAAGLFTIPGGELFLRRVTTVGWLRKRVSFGVRDSVRRE